jgi:UPF0755 protein
VPALIVLVLLGAAASAGAWLMLDHAMQRPGGNPGVERVIVPAGASVRSVLRRLEEADLVPSARVAEIYLRVRRLPVRLAIGAYDFPPYASPAQVLEQLASGRTTLESVTIVEGWTFAEMRRALDAQADLAHEWKDLDASELMDRLGASGVNPEGRFFPDTYRFAVGSPDRRIYELAYARMQRELATAWAGRAADLPLADPDGALVLASIVEKETGRADERGKVAAVFVNRLRIGMPLQSDPTVIYGLGAGYDGNIRKRDLQTDTPYNTYTRKGLPPTPIALPGAAALQAALHPADTRALYFVATGLGDGSHRFSATLTEHNAAVQEFLARLRQGRSAP